MEAHPAITMLTRVALVLVALSTPGVAAGTDASSSRECSGFGCRHARPITPINPYGLDFGWRGNWQSSGVPTRALAMATAQASFAGEACKGVSNRKRLNFGIRYLGIYSMRAETGYLKPFNEGVDAFKQNYEASWRTLDEPRRKQFCDAYRADVDFDITRIKVLPTEFYLQFLAPLSDEGLQEREKKLKRAEKVKWLALAGQLLSIAAQVSAGHDAINVGNSALQKGSEGNLSGMNLGMSQSSQLFDISSSYFNVGNYFATLQPGTSRDPMSAVATQVTDCETITHFAMWDAPRNEHIWSHYQSFSTGCMALTNL